MLGHMFGAFEHSKFNFVSIFGFWILQTYKVINLIEQK